MAEQFSFVTGDVGSSKIAQSLMSAIVERGHTAEGLLQFGDFVRDFRESVERVLADTRVLCLGFSSTATYAAAELYAAETAIRLKVPYGFYTDSFGAVGGHAWIPRHIRTRAAFVVVVNAFEVDAARRRFPNAKVHIAPNPQWGPVVVDKERRALFRRAHDIAPSTRVIALGTPKFLVLTTLLVAGIVECMSPRDVLFVGLHPGERRTRTITAVAEQYEMFKKELCAPSALFLGGTNQQLTGRANVIFAEDVPQLDIAFGADYCVDFASGLAVDMARQGKGVANFFPTLVRGRMRTLIGNAEFTPIKHGAHALAWDTEELRPLLRPGSHTGRERRAQRAVYGHMDSNESLRSTAKFLEDIS